MVRTGRALGADEAAGAAGTGGRGAGRELAEHQVAGVTLDQDHHASRSRPAQHGIDLSAARRAR